ncbi:hypothetical protein L7F22_015806 [Adiantum nelumboides]|nr:hypothetical protein [Adiantum nelumboides]
MDVNNAFLNGLLEEEVYMQQPKGYVVAGKEGMVCKLKKSLYGLKQAPRAWYGKIDDHLQSQGFQRSNIDHTLYCKVQGKDIVLVILYVDDLILTGSNEAMVEDGQSKLSKEFEIKDPGELHYIFGIEVSQLKKGDIFISQQMCDNTSAKVLAKNPVMHQRTKHIEVREHFIREKVQSGYISLHHCNTKENVADILTKALGKELFFKHRFALGMMELPLREGVEQ